jgi:hypothetical protein
MAFRDLFAKWFDHPTVISAPARFHASVTKHDTNILDPVPRALRIGGAGTVVVEDEAGVTVTYTCSAGEVLLIRAHKVKTASTATDIVAWW